jgi:hypothetical protein
MVGQKTLITDLRMGVGSVSKREGARVCARARQSDLDGLKNRFAVVVDELHHLGVICVALACGVHGL